MSASSSRQAIASFARIWPSRRRGWAADRRAAWSGAGRFRTKGTCLRSPCTSASHSWNTSGRASRAVESRRSAVAVTHSLRIRRRRRVQRSDRQRSTSCANSRSSSRRRVARQAGVDRPGLDDRARGRDQPVEALGRRAAAAIGPPVRVAGGDPLDRRSSARTSAASHPGASAASSASSRCVRAPRNRSGRQNSTTPALTASPRSTRGTTRSAAYWNGLRDADTLGLLGQLARRPRAARARNSAYGSPSAHSRRDAARRRAAGSARAGQARVGLGDRARGGQQHVVADRRERAAWRGRPDRRRGTRTAPRRGRSATGSPCQRSRFGLRGVRSTLVTSASSQTTSAASSAVRRVASGRRAASPAGSRRRG